MPGCWRFRPGINQPPRADHTGSFRGSLSIRLPWGPNDLRPAAHRANSSASSVVRFNTASSRRTFAGSVDVLHSRAQVVEHAAMIESALEHRGMQRFSVCV